MSEQQTPAATDDDLNDKQRQFVREYLIDLNGAQAAIRAGYSAKTARNIATALLAKVHIASAVAAEMAERAKRTEITADKVITELWAIARADANELVQYRRTCCRHCWGEGFKRQETQGERDERAAKWEADKTAFRGDALPARLATFDDLGGIGFDERNDPNHECPECFGQGEGQAYITDTRDLSPDARKLYAGVKVTKDGFEVKMHDKANALVQVGRHLGLFTDKQEFTGAVTVNINGADADL